MSDSGGDIDDELLALAGATDKNRKRRQASSHKSSTSKRRKQATNLDTDSDDQPESEEDESNPYPLEDKYKDEEDRQWLMQMPEVKREAILAQRLEDMQRIQDKRNLDEMLKTQMGHSAEADSVAKAAKRQHAVRGATKEKSRKLDELKARRKAQNEKKTTKTNSPKRDRSSSPMDMEISSEEEEDGQISKFEEEEEKDRKLYDKAHPESEDITLVDLDKCRLTRNLLDKYCTAPWFEEYVKGAWVRFLVGAENGQPVYRICEIQNLSDNNKQYKMNDKLHHQHIELKHGTSQKYWPMEKVSNSPFQPGEFERWVKTCNAQKVKLPTKRLLERKALQLAKLPNQPMTESEITTMIARKNLLSSSRHTATSMTMEKSRLTQARTLALRRQDYVEVEEIDARLAELTAKVGSTGGNGHAEDISDMLAKVNERNRKANLEAVRKAELLETERKRRERKLVAGTGTATPTDSSARLKTIPRLFNNTSRPGTPNLTPTPVLGSQEAGGRPISPLPSSVLSGSPSKDNAKKSFETTIIESIEVDLGDF